MKIYVDIDNTICSQVVGDHGMITLQRLISYAMRVMKLFITPQEGQSVK